MRIRTLLQRISLEALRAAIVYPLTQCEAEPLAQAYAPMFKELLTKWAATSAKKLELDDKAAAAQARRDRADARLDLLADRVSMEVLLLTGGDYDSVTYKHFFGNKTLSAFKKPRLGSQLTAMNGWIGSLELGGLPTLMALLPELVAAVDEANEANELKTAVTREKAQFRDFGERKQLVDEVNAVRKSVHGELGKLPHQNMGLPNDFADRFFRADTGDDGREKSEEEPEAEEPTIESVSAKLNDLKQQTAETEALLEELKAKKIADEKAAAAREADKVALAELRKSIAEKEKLASALAARLGVT